MNGEPVLVWVPLLSRHLPLGFLLALGLLQVSSTLSKYLQQGEIIH